MLGLKKISDNFVHARIPLPSFITKLIVGKRIALYRYVWFISSNFQKSRFLNFTYINIIFISGKLANNILSLIKNNVYSVFWSYKDSLIFLIKNTEMVFRITGPRSLELNNSNYENLKLIYKLDLNITPKPLGRYSVNDINIFSESLLIQGNSHKILQYEEVFKGLYALYRKSFIQRSFKDVSKGLLEKYENLVPLKYKDQFNKLCRKKIEFIKGQSTDIAPIACSQIHGDLTYRNIIKGNINFLYLDLDRSELSFPEFDLFMLYIDIKMTGEALSSYQNSLDLISHLPDDKNIKDSLEKFYDEIPDFSINQQYLSRLISLYYVRCLAYIFSDANFDSKIPTNFS